MHIIYVYIYIYFYKIQHKFLSTSVTKLIIIIIKYTMICNKINYVVIVIKRNHCLDNLSMEITQNNENNN